jgi:DNA-binding SARP family transcriptional activator
LQLAPHPPATWAPGRSARGRARLCLVSRFELTLDGAPVPLPMTAQRVLAFLALHNRPLLRPVVAGTLWPETAEARANASLRSALWRLKSCGSAAVNASGTYLRIAPEIDVDLHETLPIIHGLLDRSIPCHQLSLWELAIAGDLLPDWYDDWLLIERERFRQLRLHALEALCDQLTSLGRFVEAIEAGLLAVSGEPLRESAHRTLIKAYLAEGNHAEAVRHYRLCRRLLQRELGVAPSPQLVKLLDDRDGAMTSEVTDP